jgi:hypothetical protein
MRISLNLAKEIIPYPYLKIDSLEKQSLLNGTYYDHPFLLLLVIYFEKNFHQY